MDIGNANKIDLTPVSAHWRNAELTDNEICSRLEISEGKWLSTHNLFTYA